MEIPTHIADRPYQLWSYTVGHKQLLFRSVKDQLRDTRVDIVFVNVRELHIETHYHPFQVTTAAPSTTGPPIERSALRTYYIEGSFQGFVAAGAGGWCEDDGAWDLPSHFSLPGFDDVGLTVLGEGSF